jgi:tRNA pseudouridine38-40 synthase
MRYKLTIAYRGTKFHGWQTQAVNQTWKGPMPPKGHGIPTIQENLRRALIKVVGHDVNVVGSSRTDSGVHAKAQIAHFDTDQDQIPPEGLRRSVNTKLPDDILVRYIEPVPDTFDAIWSTARKRYQYFIWSALDRPPFFSDMVWHQWKPLDLDAMKEGAKYFVGQHDFASFARPGHTRENTVRTIYDCSICFRAPRLVIGVEGNGFLWNMVRIMVGTLLDVGLGRFKPEEMKQMLEAKDRKAAGLTAPPQGLYLQWIKMREASKKPGDLVSDDTNVYRSSTDG